jgi:hypothetical protein
MYPMRMTHPRAGFTIVEAVVAAALLLATCVAVSRVLDGSIRAEASARHRVRLEEVLTSECQRLAGLPFFVESAGAGVADGPSAPDSLVAEVFPRGLSAQNSDDAFYVGTSGGDEAGTFVTRSRVGEVTLSRHAVFLEDERDGAALVSSTEVDCWDCTTGAELPATCLAVTIQAAGWGRSLSRTVLLTALRPKVEPSAAPLAAG